MEREPETIPFETATQWEQWLEANHDRPEGVWMKVAKKGSGVASITISEALDIALCFGWIDSVRHGLDDRYFLRRYTPRRPKSNWSQVNVEKVERLLADGRMRPQGLAEVEAAKADGRWDGAYPAQRNATVPDDLAAALASDPERLAAFDALGKTARFAIIASLELTRTPELRAKRLAAALERLGAA